ncbi:prolyl-tRNA synthetase associated domain-containing protein [Solibaculum mannosilyticum]|uniref:prolyl-tRNA synthetase associated domain-containing protein n=1 Tax=Solibaculum mannosilyticum TaxID=2780922 RepID=UPI0034BB9B31
MNKEEVIQYLEGKSIPFDVMDHPAVYTIEDMEELHITDQGDVCKNLFLRDAKGKRHFLVTLLKDKRADLKKIQEQLGCTKLSFASEQRLQTYLGLTKGSVTPLGILNDTECCVEMVFDRELIGKSRLGVHPNENTATLWISFEDLLNLVKQHGNPIHMLDIEP